MDDATLLSVYQHLRQVARATMARHERPLTIQPTALVHEAYLRLQRAGLTDWSNRAMVIAAAARAMRNVLVERARRRATVKHGGERLRVSIDVDALSAPAASVDAVELEAALERLERKDPRVAQVLTLRFFGDLSIEQVADVLGLSVATVNRDWRFARAWLRRELGATSGDPAGR